MFWKKKKKKDLIDWEPTIISLSEQFEDYNYLGYSTPHFVNENNEMTSSVILLFYEHKTKPLRKIVRLPPDIPRAYETHNFYIQCVLWTTNEYNHREVIFNPTPYLREMMLKEGYKLYTKGKGAKWVKIDESPDPAKDDDKIIKVDFRKKDS